MHNQQAKATLWAEEFISELAKDNFSLDKYLTPSAIENAKILNDVSNQYNF